MVDVSEKPLTRRRAVAVGYLKCSADTIVALKQQALPKGDVLTVAQLAGVQAVKKTDDLIPLCHSLPLSHVDVTFEIQAEAIHIRCEATTVAATGVEMEALTGVSVAALTLFDMCKAVDTSMEIGGIRVLEKTKQPIKGGE